MVGEGLSEKAAFWVLWRTQKKSGAELCRCTGRALLLQGGASAKTLMPGCPCCLRTSKDFSGAGVGTTESGGDEVRTGADDEGQA